MECVIREVPLFYESYGTGTPIIMLHGFSCDHRQLKGCLAGRQDHVAGYRDAWRILENYPHGTFAILDRAGHNLPIEQPQLFNALVSEWLDRVRESM